MSTLQESDKVKIDSMVDFFKQGSRTPVYRYPSEVGLKYEEITFPSMDGVPLEGWFIPGSSNKIIICNHFMPGNRYGYAGHTKGLEGFGGFEVNLLPYYKALHDAGYNILAYDIRNHGLSGAAAGGKCLLGLREYRDVIGSLQYVNSRVDTKKMEKGLMSICLGCNSTFVAMDKHPEYFEDIKVMIGLQPISIRYFFQRAAEMMKLDAEPAYEYFDQGMKNATGFHVDEFSPLPYSKACKIPVKVFQVHDDFRTDVQDVQRIYDNILSKEKELHWIEGTDERFQGYNFFSKNPQYMLEWYAKYFK